MDYLIFPLAYLCGSIPFGLIISKVFLGVDPRKSGSGNIGMTNVMRTAGKLPGVITFLLDFGKGCLPTIVSRWLYEDDFTTALVASCAIIGHVHPVWLKFKGGKGVATNLGGWAGFLLWVGLAGGVSWIIVYKIFRVSSIAGMTSTVVIAISVAIFTGLGEATFIAALLSLYIIFLHRANIRRIFRGEELKMVKK